MRTSVFVDAQTPRDNNNNNNNNNIIIIIIIIIIIQTSVQRVKSLLTPAMSPLALAQHF
ncbi:hypothetical protein K504DRAFT_458953 [Pleomassaria siparia CBS 279.74]|uniref:Uncharacterized protein n=1 Tax=Pleomassaria siparia CBS 279.74 TaxID=1314801 RepID=A0A6G1K127_9PLEO|nr:hypothetical protein K504DRAFT_458953 [Pleomassaria siparia CBS 279.74]